MDDIEDLMHFREEPRKHSILHERANVSGIHAGRTVYVQSYGCGHNVQDGEVMAGLLSEQGYNVTTQFDESVDVFLVNSCTVKNPSESSFRSLVDKAKDTGKPVVVSGCVPQADSKNEKQWEDVSVIGVQQIQRVCEVVDEALNGNRIHLLGRSKKEKPSLDLPKIRRNKWIEIIPINLGCKGDCTYCKTKFARGSLISYSVDEILQRVKQSIAEGVTEIRLTSEDTGAYGLDIGTNLTELLEAVLAVLPEHVMLKLGMGNPPFMLSQIEGLARCLNHPRMYSALHIPVQSGSNHVLSLMKREYTVEQFEFLCDGLLERVPQLTLATDIICGFPGETEQDFQETMQLMRKYKFAVCNISQFYARPGTVAASPAWKHLRLDSKIIKDRSRRISEFFNDGIVNPHEKKMGKTFRVWVTEIAHDGVNLAAHSKDYTQVILPAGSAAMGTNLECEIIEQGRFFVRGRPVVDPETPQQGLLSRNVPIFISLAILFLAIWWWCWLHM